MRESCVLYVRMALSGWSHSVLDQFKVPLQTAIAVRALFRVGVGSRLMQTYGRHR